MLSSGNENGDTWQKILCLLKEACPIISNQGYGDVDTDGVVRPPFLFISDRDKGLKPALNSLFPDKYEMRCPKHIEANVAQKFGKQCARYVCAIAKTFSTRHEVSRGHYKWGCALAEHSVPLVTNKYATKIWNCDVERQ
jgi:hypothetical protein